jgi:RNA polymerase sigma-70 factor (ECF subfamily)
MTDSGKSIWPNGEQTGALLVAAKSGDTQAVNQLLERHRGAVRRLVELRLDRKVQRRVDVSDVVQDVMFEASGRLDRYLQDPAMAFHLWIRQIAWDRIIDTYRRHRVSAKRNMDREQPMQGGHEDDPNTIAWVTQLRDPAQTPATAAAQAELSRTVESAIHRLGEQDREVILMRHFEHLSNLEIAEVLGLNPPAASMRYLRAVRRLRQVLEGADQSAAEGHEPDR